MLEKRTNIHQSSIGVENKRVRLVENDNSASIKLINSLTIKVNGNNNKPMVK